MDENKPSACLNIRQLAKQRRLAYATVKLNTDHLPDAECDRIGFHYNAETRLVLTTDQTKRLADLLFEIVSQKASG